MKKILLATLATVFFTVPAQALFELRAGYGVNTPSEDSIGTSTIETMKGFNLDAIVELPMMPLGLGLRYENMGMDINQLAPALPLETKMTRISALVNYRIIDLFAYFGLIGTIGLVNDVKIMIPGSADAEYDASVTYSAGVEGGVSLGLIMLGAEVGYFGGNFEPTGTTTGSDLELNGIYAKAIVGVGF